MLRLPWAAALARVAAALCDRMTETALLDSPSAARLFAHAVPRPLRAISLASGRAALKAADAKSASHCQRMRWTTCWRVRRLGRDPRTWS